MPLNMLPHRLAGVLRVSEEETKAAFLVDLEHYARLQLQLVHLSFQPTAGS